MLYKNYQKYRLEIWACLSSWRYSIHFVRAEARWATREHNAPSSHGPLRLNLKCRLFHAKCLDTYDTIGLVLTFTRAHFPCHLYSLPLPIFVMSLLDTKRAYTLLGQEEGVAETKEQSKDTPPKVIHLKLSTSVLEELLASQRNGSSTQLKLPQGSDPVSNLKGKGNILLFHCLPPTSSCLH
jgi:hypothetical protein